MGKVVSSVKFWDLHVKLALLSFETNSLNNTCTTSLQMSTDQIRTNAAKDKCKNAANDTTSDSPCIQGVTRACGRSGVVLAMRGGQSCRHKSLGGKSTRGSRVCCEVGLS